MGEADSGASKASDLKDSVNLPKTDFPMKASLPQREPKMLEWWEQQGIYGKVLARNAGKELFVFHDGPPYANGHIHLGHVLNKTLKDIVVKYANMSGRLAEFVPGWDCHGLPIELKTEEELGSKKKEMSKVEVRKACRKYAEKFIGIQREEFKRLGVFAGWSDPYLTMTYGYEAQTVRELAKFARRGSLVRGKKPVHWCMRDRTALAEAEVEYDEHTSPSIYVAFPLQGDLPEPALKGRKAELVIWTTTPWTLPANLAISVHPEVTYVAYELGSRVIVVAKDLLSAFLSECAPDELAIRDVKLGAEGSSGSTGESAKLEAQVAALKEPKKLLGFIEGKSLEGLKYTHVLNGRTCPVILGEHVTTESGTGLVHTAPGHGAEDYDVGRRYGLEVLAPVDAGGRFTPEAGEFQGERIWDANPKIIAKLHETKVLLSDPNAKISHSYPHCWRCKSPVIFRATAQWFISMAANDLRKRALEEIDRVQWIPKWGRERIYGMIENRPDWCVSRQRAWGVPIAVFYCASDACEEPIVDADAMDRVAEAFEKEGADAWFTHEAEEFLGAGRACGKCGGTRFRKEEDILDVWFDSGVSFAAVAEKRPNMHAPVDLYLEGSDQHRGWFHSALLCSVGTRDAAPYKAVLTHGFVVDGEGRKMSKSMGNVIAPEKTIKDLGAEILRLWVSAADYRDDIRLSPKILEGLAEGYRKIRNTLRYALGNLHDFDPAKDALPASELQPIDRWAQARLAQLTQKVRKAYEEYEFHVVYHSVLDFCAVDLSAVYFDVLKDRLYTGPRKSRRAAQTVVHQIVTSLLQLLAPIMSFTAEEAWGYLPHKQAESVFLTDMPEGTFTANDEKVLAEFDRLLAVRSEVQKTLEAARREKLIGAPLEAKVVLQAGGDLLAFLQGRLQELGPLFIVSKVELSEGGSGETVTVKVERAPGEKCPRCWNYSEAITAEQPVCLKCREALEERKA